MLWQFSRSVRRSKGEGKGAPQGRVKVQEAEKGSAEVDLANGLENCEKMLEESAGKETYWKTKLKYLHAAFITEQEHYAGVFEDEADLSARKRQSKNPVCTEEDLDMEEQSLVFAPRTDPDLSLDFIGGWLVSRLLNSARRVKNDKPIAGWSKTPFERLVNYEDESRLLVKLADTGRVIQLLERGVDTTLHILDIYSEETRNSWREKLWLEREKRAAVYQELLMSEEVLDAEMGDEDQQLEVLTLIRHGVDKFGSVLTSRECDVISSIFNAIVWRSKTVIGVLPKWFVAARPDNARLTSMYEGEEACLRQAAVWASLHHPYIRKFYGASHVGAPFVLHEEDQPGPPTWSFFRDCALGLEYVHRRGFSHEGLTASFSRYKGFRPPIFAMLAQARSKQNLKPDFELQSSKPDFVSQDEWNLLETFCTSEPSHELRVGDFFVRMEELNRVQEKHRRSQEIYSSSPSELECRASCPVDDITTYILPTAARTIASLLQEADPLCDAVGESGGANRSVYNRLIDLYGQFVAHPHPLPFDLVEDYAMIVWSFYVKLDKQSDPFYSASSLCRARTIANRSHSLQRDVDDLIAKSSGVLCSSKTHAWEYLPHSSNPGNIEDDKKFEGNVDEDNFLQIGNRSSTIDIASSRPTWFIPVAEVSRKDYIADGAFGAVYKAAWLGTSVVLKQLFPDESKKVNRKQFYWEANLWFNLNHKHLIELYGANHEERPFFVCENAIGRTLPAFLKREQRGRRERLWNCLQQAALGLESLHDQGIVHGDLKGNNILVWMAHVTDFDSATTKIADFGLCILANAVSPSINQKSLGAIPWKAPECLSGSAPTMASDVYSFGMCIIEAATGSYPWGRSIDEVIRDNVTQHKKIPSRPPELNEYQWKLITRMCCFDPRRRINAGAVVNILCNGAFDGEADSGGNGNYDAFDQESGAGNPRGITGSEESSSSTVTPRPVTLRTRKAVQRWHKSNRPPNVVQTPDRLGDYLVALRNDFIAKHPTCRRGLKLLGQLSAYEKEPRELLKLASTGRVVSILLRFGRVIESYMEVMYMEVTVEVRRWKEQLELERQQRLKTFDKLLNDKQCLVQAMGDETQQMEMLTLLKHDVATYQELLTPMELDVMSDTYDHVVDHSGIVLVGKLPTWFLPPNDLLCENGIYYLDTVRVSKCVIGEVLRPGGGDHHSWEDQEEACLRQATLWADLKHPHVAKLLGGCHIGKETFVVHEPAEPLVSNREKAQSWEPLLGWALGLQYLHERELGYKNFDGSRLLARHHVTASGVLSGLGLVPIKRKMSASLKRGISNIFNMKVLEVSLLRSDDDGIPREATTWSVPNDIFAFGLAIYNTLQWVTNYNDEEVLVLPPECPPFLIEQEWDLIQRMCARTPEKRVSMWYVVHQLQAYVKASEPKNKKLPLYLSADPKDEVNEETVQQLYSPPEHIDDFIVPKMGVKVVKAMTILESICTRTGQSDAMLQDVFKRLSSLHTQLQTPGNIKDAAKVMEAFVNVMDLFYTLLTRRDLGKNQSNVSEVASFCASRAAAQNVAIFHHEIDRLLTLAEQRDTSASAQAPSHVTLADTRENSSESITSDLGTPDIHNWQLEWNKWRREHLRDFQNCLRNTESLKEQLRDPNDRLEAQMLLQFELHKRRSSYPNSVLDAITQALNAIGEGAEAVPSWFIPPYEVVLGKHIAEGGSSTVYYGKWFDTDVVIKILKSQLPAATAPETGASPSASSSGSSDEDEDAMKLFRREADHWFMLSHQNVVHLYGACHVGTPFFVCEPAKSTSLYTHVKDLACAKSGYNFEESGSDPSDIMRCLLLAGIGLKYLHERGIVHCDLKGNDFMVGTDGKTIKLGDLGMSVLKRSGKGRHAAYKNVGAVPWKAPECLKGEYPTVMSDVYSFGMCILELLSGKIPWAGVPYAAVKFLVIKREALPPRPKKLTDLQWSLIQHMCCFNPSERISLDSVVDMLHTFRFE